MGSLGAQTHVRDRKGRRRAVLKVFYLLVVTTAVFAVRAISVRYAWAIILAAAAVQAVVLLAAHVPVDRILRPLWRLKWFFAFVLVMYALLPPDDSFVSQTVFSLPMPALGWTASINLGGLQQAALMCLQITAVVLATAVVRLTGTGRDLIDGLHALHLPLVFIYSLDRTLELIGGRARSPSQGRRDERRQGSGSISQFSRLARGDFSAFADSIRSNLTRAGASDAPEDRLGHDVAVVTGVALCMASLKMLKTLPGLPFASGHKTFLLFPLYVLAARLTNTRWGATSTGSIMGVIGLLQGDGRFGPFEVFKHIAPGVIIDLGDGLVRRLPWPLLGYCLLGLLAAVGRTATEFIVLLLLGSRAEIYLFPAVKLVPNLIAGGLSGFATVFVLRVFARSAHPIPPLNADTK